MKVNHSEEKGKGKIQSLIDNKGSTIAVTLALIFVSSLLLSYYFISRLPPEGYTTIYNLDYQHKKAIDFPELLIINENNTFNVWVVVENHMGKTISCEVLQKVTNDMIHSFPVETEAENSYTQTIENGEAWETLTEVTINEPGSYSVIFELWIYNDKGVLEFSYNYCVLKMEVVDQI